MQEQVPAGTPIGGLPVQIERVCCTGKSCGNTDLKLKVLADLVDGAVVLSFTYIRPSNGVQYWRPVKQIDKLIELLNDQYYWPQDEARTGATAE